MANQISVNTGSGSGAQQVIVDSNGNITVTVSRSVIGTVANVASANYANFAGNVVNAAQPNITSVGTLSNLTVSNTITTNNLVVTGNFSVGNLVANNANYANFAGNAFAVAGANVSGTVANATFATTAGSANTANTANSATVANSANAVAGANVSGTVANATFATTAGSANTANSAIVANSANSVAGANVSGTVANATYADNAGNANFANSATVASSANSVTLANVSGAGNIASINLDGSTSNVLYGNGIFAPAAGGNTANANYANFAGNAFSVDGSNVVGAVANATFALDAGNANIANIAYSVDGANVSGTVANATFALDAGNANIANIAYSVDGANVSGAVANATFALDAGNANIANIAYSVDAANVSGLGNIATINLDGNVSNLLTGNGTFVAIPTVSANANYANFAGDVVNSAQPNITSVGNLSALTVTGTLTGNAITWSNLITYTGNATVSDKILIQADLAGTPATRNLGLRAGNITNVSASNTQAGGFQLNGGTAVSTDAGNAWIARTGPITINTGAASTANGAAFSGALNLLQGQAISSNANATVSGFVLGSAVAVATNGNAIIQNGSVGSGLANATNGNAFGGQTFIQSPGARTNTSGNAFGGTLNLSGGNARSENGSATSGNVNISTALAIANVTTGVATVGSINISCGTANGITANVFGNINIGTTGGLNSINIGQSFTPVIVAGNLSANIVTANYLYGDGSNITGISGGSAAGSDTQIQYNSNGAFGASSALTFDGGNLAVGGNLFLNTNSSSQAIVVSQEGSGGISSYNMHNDTSVFTVQSFYRTRGNASAQTAVSTNDTIFTQNYSVYGDSGNTFVNAGYQENKVGTNYGNGEVSLVTSFVASYAGSSFNVNGYDNIYLNGTVNAGNVQINGNTRQVNLYGLGEQPPANGVYSQLNVFNGQLSVSQDNIGGGLGTFSMNQWENTTAYLNPYAFFRARGNSSSPQPVANGDAVMTQSFIAYGDSGNTYVNVGNFGAYVNTNDGAGNVSGSLVLGTPNNNDGSSVQLYSDIINLDGNVTTPKDINVNSGNVIIGANGRLDYLRTFGSFTSNATQTSNGANTTNYVTLNNTEDANGISIANSSEITVARPGRYNIQFSAQLEKTDAGDDIVEIWLTQNGNAIANSAGQVTLVGNGAKAIAAWDYNVNAANVNDYFELAWASPDTAVQLTAIDTANTISGVAIPSIIVDINPIGA